MIEFVSKQDIGFTCWQLFTINYFRCYIVIKAINSIPLFLFNFS